eukprot:683852-Amphidinium_carterae.1
MGITQLEDAAETLIKLEWSNFRKGLEWSLATLEGCSIVTAIIALREICSNWEWKPTESGGQLCPMMGR